MAAPRGRGRAWEQPRAAQHRGDAASRHGACAAATEPPILPVSRTPAPEPGREARRVYRADGALCCREPQGRRRPHRVLPLLSGHGSVAQGCARAPLRRPGEGAWAGSSRSPAVLPVTYQAPAVGRAACRAVTPFPPLLRRHCTPARVPGGGTDSPRAWAARPGGSGSSVALRKLLPSFQSGPQPSPVGGPAALHPAPCDDSVSGSGRPQGSPSGVAEGAEHSGLPTAAGVCSGAASVENSTAGPQRISRRTARWRAALPSARPGLTLTCAHSSRVEAAHASARGDRGSSTRGTVAQPGRGGGPVTCSGTLCRGGTAGRGAVGCQARTAQSAARIQPITVSVLSSGGDRVSLNKPQPDKRLSATFNSGRRDLVLAQGSAPSARSRRPARAVRAPPAAAS